MPGLGLWKLKVARDDPEKTGANWRVPFGDWVHSKIIPYTSKGWSIFSSEALLDFVWAVAVGGRGGIWVSRVCCVCFLSAPFWGWIQRETKWTPPSFGFVETNPVGALEGAEIREASQKGANQL